MMSISEELPWSTYFGTANSRNKEEQMNQEREDRKLATRTSVYLWEFLLEMLEDEDCRFFIRWLDKSKREFFIKDPEEAAKLWGVLKQRPLMNKKKFCRAIRYYYNSQLITKIPGKRFCYKFGKTPYHHPAFTSTANDDKTKMTSMDAQNSENCWKEDSIGQSNVKPEKKRKTS